MSMTTTSPRAEQLKRFIAGYEANERYLERKLADIRQKRAAYERQLRAIDFRQLHASTDHAYLGTGHEE